MRRPYDVAQAVRRAYPDANVKVINNDPQNVYLDGAPFPVDEGIVDAQGANILAEKKLEEFQQEAINILAEKWPHYLLILMGADQPGEKAQLTVDSNQVAAELRRLSLALAAASSYQDAEAVTPSWPTL